MKKILAIVMTFAVLFGVFSVAFAAEDGVINSVESAAEVPEGYTAIRTAEDLNNIRNNLAGKYILMNDIDLSVYENWVPIGDAENPFTGELDGNGFMIKNLSINIKDNQETAYIGLISTGEGTVKNLTIINATISSEQTDNSVYSTAYVGIISGSETDLYNNVIEGSVSVKGYETNYVGGMIGYKYGSGTENCANYADVTVTTDSGADLICAGGILGELTDGNAKLCCNYGNITVNGENVSSEAKVYAGGIIGYSNCQVHFNELVDSYNRGNVAVDFAINKSFAGGLLGEGGTIINLYGVGKVTNLSENNKYTGSVVGKFFEPDLAISSPEINNLYYIEGAQTSSIESIYPAIHALTEEEFKKQESFAGFDFDEVWAMEENGYPVLQNQPIINVKEDVELEIGDTFELPDYESVKSADENIAKANENEIIALSAGITTVTLTHAYGYYTEYTVTVAEEETTTELTTEVTTTEPVTETTTEKVEVSTTIPEPSATEKEETTQPTTSPVTEPETQPSTVPESTTSPEPTTEPASTPEETTTKPADDPKCPFKDCWLIKFFKQFFNFICEVVCELLGRAV